jgi:hypothetical protein
MTRVRRSRPKVCQLGVPMSTSMRLARQKDGCDDDFTGAQSIIVLQQYAEDRSMQGETPESTLREFGCQLLTKAGVPHSDTAVHIAANMLARQVAATLLVPSAKEFGSYPQVHLIFAENQDDILDRMNSATGAVAWGMAGRPKAETDEKFIQASQTLLELMNKQLAGLVGGADESVLRVLRELAGR